MLPSIVLLFAVMMEAKGDKPFGFYSGWQEGKDKDEERFFYSIAYFIPPKVPEDDVVLGIVGFDPDYLRNTFFPGVINDVLSSKSTAVHDANPPALMVRPSKGYTPWIASANWDGGKAEMERSLSEAFEGMVFAIKYPGTTIDEIGAKFLRSNYIILGALSVLMAGGLLLTYRNVSREMKLARLKSDFVANVSHAQFKERGAKIVASPQVRVSKCFVENNFGFRLAFAMDMQSPT